MRMRLIVVAAVVLVLLPGAFAQGTGKASCDRACLENYVNRYMDAMQANDPSLELFTKNCKFTENGVRLPLGGEGLWYSMSGKGNYKFYVPDIETQQVAFIGTVLEGGGAPSKKATPGAKPSEGTLAAYALRLKIADNGKISEAEQLVIRPESNLFGGGEASASAFPPTGESVEKMGAPHEMYMEAIPEAERMSRGDLVEVANYYFEGLQRNDGKGYYPFTDDCMRHENGMVTTTECKKQFESGALANIVSRIRDRRFVAVDRERGIAFAFGFFDHVSINFTWQLAELFKIEKGQIRRIEAVFHQCPYGTNSGWSTYEQGISEEPQSIR